MEAREEAVVLQQVEAGCRRAATGGSNIADCSGAATSKGTKDDAMVLLQQVEPVEMVQWHCNKWNSKQQRRCSGAAIAKSSRVDPMVLQQVETTEKM